MTDIAPAAGLRRERGMARAAVAPGAPVAERMDALPLTRLHVLVLVVGSLAFAFDLMEAALGNALSAVFSAPPYSSDATTLSWLLSSMYVGAVFGAPVAGLLADRYGRRAVLSAVLLVLAVTSAAAAAAPDVWFLIGARMLSGIALGAFPPLLIAYFTDIMPPSMRGKIIMVAAGLAALGPLGMVFLIRWLTPIEPFGIEAWRWAFILGTGGALVTALAFLMLPESPRWLAARGEAARAERAAAAFERSPAVLDAAPPAPAPRAAEAASAPFDRRRFTVLAVIYFLGPWAFTFPLAMGAVLIQKGFDLRASLFYVGVSMIGPVIGTLAGALFVDRIERRAALALFSAVMIVSMIAFAMTTQPAWLIVSALAFQITGLLYVPTLTLYTAELFPTRYRGRTSATTWAINRVASAVAPFVLLPLLKDVGIWAMFSVMVGALALGIVVVLGFGERGRGLKPVD